MCLILVLVFKFITFKSDKTKTVMNTIYDSSQSSIVMNANTLEVLYENNIHQRMLPASTTKILTCLTSIKLFDLDQLIYVTKDMINIEGSSIYLEDGDVISVNDLLYGLMLCSGNDAASVLAKSYSGKEEDFIFEMNKLAKAIGMNESTFENPHGLDQTTKNYTTVYDMALLMSYAIKDETFKKINQTISYNPVIASGKRLYFHNKHKLITSYDYATGGKTGYTKLARRTLVTSFKKDELELVVVSFNCSNDFELHTMFFEYFSKQYQ